MIERTPAQIFPLADFCTPQFNVTTSSTESPSTILFETFQLKKLFRTSDKFLDFFQRNNLVDPLNEFYGAYCKQTLPQLSEEDLVELDQFCDKKFKVKNEFGFDFEVEISLREFYIDLQKQLNEKGSPDSCLHMIDLIGSAVFYFLKVKYALAAFKEFAKQNPDKFPPEILKEFELLLVEVFKGDIEKKLGGFPNDFDLRVKLGNSPIPYVIEGLSFKLINYIQRQINWKLKEAPALEAFEKIVPKREENNFSERSQCSHLTETPEYKAKQQRKLRTRLIRRLALFKWHQEPRGPWIKEECKKADTRYTTTTIGNIEANPPFKTEIMWIDRLNREVMSGSDLHLPLLDFMMKKNRVVIPTSPIKNGWQALLNFVGKTHTPGDLTKIDENDWLRLIVGYSKGINAVYPNLENLYFSKVLKVAAEKEGDDPQKQLNFIFNLVDKYIKTHKDNDPIARLTISLNIVLSESFRQNFPHDSNSFIQRLIRPNDVYIELPSQPLGLLASILAFLKKGLTIDELDQILQAGTFIQCNTAIRSIVKQAIITRKGKSNICLISAESSDNQLRLKFDPLKAFTPLTENGLSLFEALLPVRRNKSKKGLLINDLSKLGVDPAKLKEQAEALLKNRSAYSLVLGGWLFVQGQLLEPTPLSQKFIEALPHILNASSKPALFLNSIDEKLFEAIRKDLQKPIQTKKFYQAIIQKYTNASSSFKIVCFNELLKQDLTTDEKQSTWSALYKELLLSNRFNEAANLLEQNSTSTKETLDLLGFFASALKMLPIAEAILYFKQFDTLLASVNENPLEQGDSIRASSLVWGLTSPLCLLPSSEKIRRLYNLSVHWLPLETVLNTAIPFLLTQKAYLRAAECFSIRTTNENFPTALTSFLSIGSACATNKDKQVTNSIFLLLSPYLSPFISFVKGAKPSHALTQSINWLIPTLIEFNFPETAESLLNQLPDRHCLVDDTSLTPFWEMLCTKYLQTNKDPDEVYRLWESLNCSGIWDTKNVVSHLKLYIDLLKALTEKDPNNDLTRKLLPSLNISDLPSELRPALAAAYIKQWEGLIKQGKENSVRMALERPIGALVSSEEKQSLEFLMIHTITSKLPLEQMATSIPLELKQNSKLSSKDRKSLITIFTKAISHVDLSPKNTKQIWSWLHDFLHDSEVQKELSSQDRESTSIAFINRLIDREFITEALEIFKIPDLFQEQIKIDFKIRIAFNMRNKGHFTELGAALEQLTQMSYNERITTFLDETLQKLINEISKEAYQEKSIDLLIQLLCNANALRMFGNDEETFLNHSLACMERLLELQPKIGLKKTDPILVSALQFIFLSQLQGINEKLKIRIIQITTQVVERTYTSSMSLSKMLLKTVKRIYLSDCQKPLIHFYQLFLSLELNKASLCQNQMVIQNMQGIVRTFLEEDSLTEDSFEIAKKTFALVSSPSKCQNLSPIAAANLFRSMLEVYYKRKDFLNCLKIIQLYLPYKIKSDSPYSNEEQLYIRRTIESLVLTKSRNELVELLEQLKEAAFTITPKWKHFLRAISQILHIVGDYSSEGTLLLNHSEIPLHNLNHIICNLIRLKQFELCFKLLEKYNIKNPDLWRRFFKAIWHVTKEEENQKKSSESTHPLVKRALTYFKDLTFDQKTSILSECWIEVLLLMRTHLKSELPLIFESHKQLNELLDSSNKHVSFRLSIAVLLQLSMHFCSPLPAEASPEDRETFDRQKNSMGRKLFLRRKSLDAIQNDSLFERLTKIDLYLIRLTHNNLELFSEAFDYFKEPLESKANYSLPDEHHSAITQRLTAFHVAAYHQTSDLSLRHFNTLSNLVKLGIDYNLPPHVRLIMIKPYLAFCKEHSILEQGLINHLIISPYKVNIESLPPPEMEKVHHLNPSEKFIWFLLIYMHQELCDIREDNYDEKLLIKSAESIINLLCYTISNHSHSCQDLLKSIFSHPKILNILTQYHQNTLLAQWTLQKLLRVNHQVLSSPKRMEEKVIEEIIEAINFFTAKYLSHSILDNHVEQCFILISALAKMALTQNCLQQVFVPVFNALMPNSISPKSIDLIIKLMHIVLLNVFESKNERLRDLEVLFNLLKTKILQMTINFPEEKRRLCPLNIKMIFALTFDASIEEMKEAFVHFKLCEECGVFKEHPHDLLKLYLLFNPDPLQLIKSQKLTDDQQFNLIQKTAMEFIQIGNVTMLKRAHLLLCNSTFLLQNHLNDSMLLISSLLEKFRSNDLSTDNQQLLYAEFNLSEILFRNYSSAKSTTDATSLKTLYRFLNDVQRKYIGNYYSFLIQLPLLPQAGSVRKKIHSLDFCNHITLFLIQLRKSQSYLQRDVVNEYLDLIEGCQVLLAQNIHDHFQSEGINVRSGTEIQDSLKAYVDAITGPFLKNLQPQEKAKRLQVLLKWIKQLTDLQIYDQTVIKIIKEELSAPPLPNYKNLWYEGEAFLNDFKEIGKSIEQA